MSLCCAEEEDKDIMDRPMMEYHAGNVAEGRYVIRSCFGGVKCAFVASGSEVRCSTGLGTSHCNIVKDERGSYIQ